jgi:hypothetical protein
MAMGTPGRLRCPRRARRALRTFRNDPIAELSSDTGLQATADTDATEEGVGGACAPTKQAR